ncbi:hypothetical protein QE152_g29727 [Popillia japonica]|uniref:Transposase n=1 Tax=Popillia japonica TaxID=7064 RepID=A0AAW1JHD5_POPJA
MAPIPYPVEELINMVFVYALADEKRLYAERYPNRNLPQHQMFARAFLFMLLAERYPNRNLPQHQMFARAFEGFRKNGNVKLKKTERPVQLDEATLGRIEEDPTTSTRRISSMENTSKSTAWRILKEHPSHPIHYQEVQPLT